MNREEWVDREIDISASGYIKEGSSVIDLHPAIIEAQEKLSRLGGLLGDVVSTPDGVGILTSVETPGNGLYLEPDKIICTVWYSTERAQNGKVSWTYRPEEILPVWCNWQPRLT